MGQLLAGQDRGRNSEIATIYNKWLAQSADLPKLYINADPGVLSASISEVIKGWPHLRTVTVKGLHFIDRKIHLMKLDNMLQNL